MVAQLLQRFMKVFLYLTLHWLPYSGALLCSKKYKNILKIPQILYYHFLFIYFCSFWKMDESWDFLRTFYSGFQKELLCSSSWRPHQKKAMIKVTKRSQTKVWIWNLEREQNMTMKILKIKKDKTASNIKIGSMDRHLLTTWIQ